MFDVATTKVHDETRQGEAFAPFAIDPTLYQRRFYIESYGCAMNFSDSEIVASILQGEGFGATRNVEDADLIFVNTCSIREKAEMTVRKRLTEFRKLKKRRPGMLVGILGCMAERLKAKLLEEEKLVDLVIGPDAYRTLPDLIKEADGGQKGVNVLLSRDETYADISPVRLNSNGITAFVSIMRGCNNMCSFCVVPFTRGRERSRDAASIVQECRQLFDDGYKEVTLLGQNVDSYYYQSTAPLNLPGGETSLPHKGQLNRETAKESNTLQSPPSELVSSHTGGGREGAITFARLLEMVALISPDLRIRFSTSHPKDITDDVLHTMKKYENICKYIHLPLQSGSTRMLQLMNRSYTREWYKAKVDRIKEIMPDCALSSDVIAGFCTETEEDHQETLSMMAYVKYDFSYMFFYSERPGTLAQRCYEDDIPLDVKKRRLQEIVDLQGKLSHQSNREDLGKTFKVLIEGESKKDEHFWKGRNSQNKVVIFPKGAFSYKAGDYAEVHVTSCTQATLIGEIVN
ncbi:MAG: miaB [Flaviaesturariibacter sp.]|nr:miaB [Flaviaesturariibacter sp.]